MKAIDYVLNRITMYRLMFYYLIGLLFVAFLLSFLHRFSFTPQTLALSTGLFFLVSWISNIVFSKLFQAPINSESAYISGFILSLIITPVGSFEGLIHGAFVAIFAMGSKYILTGNRKHMFNPVAFGVWSVGLILGQNATWWIGTAWMLPFVIAGGFLMMRKIKRENVIYSFLIASVVTIFLFSVISGRNDFISLLTKTALETPLFFFAFVMLTEPLTMPPTRQLQIYYAVITGIFFAPQFHILSYYFSPEEALLIGNIFSYLVSPKVKLFLQLKEKIQVGSDIIDFVFIPHQNFSFSPGQYMEWTLAHRHVDSRGNRRYFTLASSPTENTLRIGVRFNNPSSSFKKQLKDIDQSTLIVAS